MNPSDTIVAISSAVGAAARMIVRASGSMALSLLASLAPAQAEKEKRAFRAQLTFSGMSVPAWIYVFVEPGSATGEDIVEFHIPGNPLLARMLLDELIRLGARQAEAGEFTARAYFNGRIGLAEAEGVAATIAAQSDRELAAARQLLSGELSRRLQPILDAIVETLALIEVGIDFSEEDVTFLSKPQVAERINQVNKALDDLLSQSSRFERLSHEPRIVLVGRPNAGKSTLLNLLSGQDRAVVSPQAGTTRDAIWAHAHLAGGVVRLIDVAGLDESGTDEISTQMQNQAKRTLEEADIVLLLRDCTDSRPAISLNRTADLKIATKADLTGRIQSDELPISAMADRNIDLLRERLNALAFGETSGGSQLALNARHVRAIELAGEALDRARQRLDDAGAEVLAMELREALDILGGIVANVSPDDVLGRIFSTFCMGK